MDEITRSLTLWSDGEEIGRNCRVRLRARAALTLAPLPCLLEIRNLPETEAARLRRAKNIATAAENTVLAAGRIAEVYRAPRTSGKRGTSSMTSVLFSPGLPLWEAGVSLSLPGGIRASDTLRAVLAASGTGIPLLNWAGPDPVFARGQAYFGRAAEAAASVLAACGAEGILLPAGLAVRKGGAEEGAAASLDAGDLREAPGWAGRDRVLQVKLCGLRPGQRVRWVFAGEEGCGVIRECLTDADTEAGPWGMEMLVRAES